MSVRYFFAFDVCGVDKGAAKPKQRERERENMRQRPTKLVRRVGAKWTNCCRCAAAKALALWCILKVIGLCVVLLRLNLETWWQSLYLCKRTPTFFVVRACVCLHERGCVPDDCPGHIIPNLYRVFTVFVVGVVVAEEIKKTQYSDVRHQPS